MQYSLLEASATSAMRPLRKYQVDAIAEMRQAIREGHKRIVLYLATGGGKTRIAAEIVNGAVKKGNRVVFTCPSIALVNQTVEAFRQDGIWNIGVMQAQHALTDWSAPVQIASVQTLIRRAIPEADVIINDEGHEVFDKLNNRLDSPEWKNKIAILLSATPGTRGLGLRWTKLIKVVTIQELVEQGFLVPSIIYAPAHAPDLSKVKIKHGEYEEESLSVVMQDPKIVGNAVKEWQEKAAGLKSFMFCVNRAHAQTQREEFLKAGISCGYIDGNSTDEERYETFRRYREGDDDIIASVGCLIRGIDEDVRCIIDLQPVKSKMRHVQKVGRGKRPALGKEFILILDGADNNYRLGEVEQIHFDKLDCRQKSDKSPDPNEEKPTPKSRKCKKCYALIPPGSPGCPACGTVPELRNIIEHEAGELVAFGTTTAATPKKQSKDVKQIAWSGFLYLAAERSFKPGWAANKYREMFGVWPRGLIDLPSRPSTAVRKFDQEKRREFFAQKKQESKQVIS